MFGGYSLRKQRSQIGRIRRIGTFLTQKQPSRTGRKTNKLVSFCLLFKLSRVDETDDKLLEDHVTGGSKKFWKLLESR